MNYLFVDSGAMYRGVTLFCMRNNLIDNGQPESEAIEKILDNITLKFITNEFTGQSELLLNDENVEAEIRSPLVAANVSKIAAIKKVREKLVKEQQEMGRNGGVVMDGRDIGSVVFPDAEIKFFVTASPEIRAKRRFDELLKNGVEISMQEVLNNLLERDQIDSTRLESPLIKTADAIEIDTSNLNREQQLELAYDYIEKYQ